MGEQERGGNGARGNHRPGLGERVEHIGSTAQQVLTEARDVVSDLKQTVDLRRRMDEHPYAMLAAAAAVGYVLGGGLLTSLTGTFIRLGLKVAALPLIKEELWNLAGSAVSGFGSRPSSPSSGEPSSSAAGASTG
jgi:hypothetical protein